MLYNRYTVSEICVKFCFCLGLHFLFDSRARAGRARRG